MIEKLEQHAPELLTNIKFAWAWVAATFGAGTSTVFELIPTHIGTVASLLGCVLTVVLIRSHRAKSALEQEKLKLEIKALKDEQDNS